MKTHMNVSLAPALDSRTPASALNPQRLLVPVDFSVGTLEALYYARKLSETSGAVVDLLHVVPCNLCRNAEAMPLGWLHAMASGAREELQRLVAILRKNEGATTYSVRVREGRAHEVIVREALATNASLIVMGIRHRSWLSTVFRRHTTKHVLRNAPCPVLLLHAGHTTARTPQAATFPLPAFLGGAATC